LRVTVKPGPAEMHEALTWDFDEITPNSTTAVLKWEKLAIPLRIEVNTAELAQKSLAAQLRGYRQYNWITWDEAANYLVDSKGSLEDALKDTDISIQNEERFENLITKGKVLDAMNRKDEADASRKKAMDMGTVIQVHIYGRQLMAQGHQDQAFDLFRTNMKKFPSHWLAHGEAARIASAKGDFDTAVKEAKLAIAVAPEPQKPQLNGLLKQLENKQDINK
jgi:tetratricopeptide (TPR) repeat protein